MELFEIVTKLIGQTTPQGESSGDKERLENVKAMTELCSDLLNRIEELSRYSDSHEYSVKIIGDYATNYLNEVARSWA